VGHLSRQKNEEFSPLRWGKDGLGGLQAMLAGISGPLQKAALC